MTIPPMLLTALLAATTTTKAKSTGSAAGNIIFLVIIVGLFYFLWRGFSRPRQQQAARQRDLLSNLSAGDEILTASGIYGTVLDVETDRITIETAPGTRMTIARSTIARRISPETIGPDGGAEHYDDLDELDPHDHGDGEGHDHDGHADGDHDDGDHEGARSADGEGPKAAADDQPATDGDHDGGGSGSR